MKRLIACANCDRYVRKDESACPFCRTALLPAGALPAATLPVGRAGLSRAASFAMRAALAVAAPGAVACGGQEGTRPRDTRPDVAAAGRQSASAGSTGQGGSSSETTSNGGPILLDANGPYGSNYPNDSNTEATADAGADAEPYAPIPIYGGVFPDPMSRARV
jgi:hypothetical protein